jgi:cytochrome c5
MAGLLEAWLTAADTRRHCARNFADDRERARGRRARRWRVAPAWRGVGVARASRAVVGVLRGECQALRARLAVQPGRGEADGWDPRVQGDVRPYVQSARLQGRAALPRMSRERHGDVRARARGPKARHFG